MDPWSTFAHARGGLQVADDEPARFRAAFDDARARWPEVEVDVEAVCSALAKLESTYAQADPLAAETIADVIIAVACHEGQTRAHAAFEERYFGSVAARVASLVPPDAETSDVIQRLRVRLFGSDARLLDYAGRGGWSQFIYVAATRIALNLRTSDRRRSEREQRFSNDAELAARVSTPELEFAKGEYRAMLKSAFENAVASLPDRDRNLLRAHLVDRLGIDPLATTYGVNRATVARWIRQARAAVADRTRTSLQEHLSRSGRNLEEIETLVKSQLDLSIARVFSQ